MKEGAACCGAQQQTLALQGVKAQEQADKSWTWFWDHLRTGPVPVGVDPDFLIKYSIILKWSFHILVWLNNNLHFLQWLVPL